MSAPTLSTQRSGATNPTGPTGSGSPPGRPQCPTRLVVVADLDGTLAFDGLPPGPATTAVLEDILDRPDIRLVLASSRPPPAIHRLMGHLAEGADLLCCNGAIRLSSCGRSSLTTLAATATSAMVRLLRGAAEEFCLDFGHWFLASTPEALPRWGDTERRSLPAGGAVPTGAVKLSVGDADRWLTPLRDVAGRAVRFFPHAATGDLDVTPLGVSKASGLDLLLRQHVGLDGGHRPPVVALGNDVNDVDLLLEADRAFVVGADLPEVDAWSHSHRVPGDDLAVAHALRSVLVPRPAVTSPGSPPAGG